MEKENKSMREQIKGLLQRIRELEIWKVNRKYKSNIFEMVFRQDREALLQLYNVLNNSNETDASDLTIVTLENALFITMKNDVAYIFSGTLCLYEHQSTWNPNMPLRMLVYLVQEYQKYLEKDNRKLYSETLLKIPTPQCVVFYNGEKEIDDEVTLSLSDAYANTSIDPSLILSVKVLNINKGHNEKYMKACRRLRDYSTFIQLVRDNQNAGMSLESAITSAIDTCIENDVLKDILIDNRSEVIGVLLDGVDMKTYKKWLVQDVTEQVYAEAHAEGLAAGHAAGHAEGLAAGHAEGLAAGHAEGLAAGLEQGRSELISVMLAKGLMPEQISEICNISLDEIIRIKSNTN